MLQSTSNNMINIAQTMIIRVGEFGIIFGLKVEALMQNSVVNRSESMSTLSTEENMTVMSSEDSSSYPDDSELELGLGLSLGGGGRAEPPAAAAAAWDQHARILTAKEVPSSSSSSLSPVTKSNDKNGCCGTKRAAPSSPPSPSTLRSQVAGWPPVANYRMNSLVNHAKLPSPRKSDSTGDKCKIMDAVVDQTNHSHDRNNNSVKESGLIKKSSFVKVNMDGISIGRKVDLKAHSCYETLAHMLDQMFTLSAAVGRRRSNVEEQLKMAGTGQPALLLDGSSDFVLTYEDKEGDWMLVGDVPWEMFLSSVRRLRIRRASEVNGPGVNALQDLMKRKGNK
ncbi:hypothetical protein C2S53_019488 [Perilla frutescens var. hirtella]|uniref:Auxin-responsive protein n=1 Tax=Perilla frutescens var. hirtella TaxID=608512 RepID=A0AAD4IUI5_PERFH|nr:hypothetical protein C2S53_019488 [Perilla frutescens var. hirtella]